jgi:hypothetical protein
MPTIGNTSTFAAIDPTSDFPSGQVDNPSVQTLFQAQFTHNNNGSFLVVGIKHLCSTGSFQATYNGVSMSPQHYCTVGEYVCITFTLANPAQGSNTVRVTGTRAAGNFECVAVAVSALTVDLIAQFRTAAPATGTGTTATATIDHQSGALALGILFGTVAATQGGSQTAVVSVGSGSNRIHVTSSEVSSNTWSIASSDWAAVGFDLIPTGTRGIKPIPAENMRTG